MISKKEYQVVVHFVKLCCSYGLLPADWNRQTNRITYPAKNKWKSYSSRILLPFHVGYVIFIQCRLSGELKSGAGVDKVILHCLFMCAHALCAVYHCHVLASPREIAGLFNLIGNFNQKQGIELLNGERYVSARIRETAVVILPKGVAAIIIAVGMTPFVKANDSNFLYSVFPLKNPVSLCIFGIFEACSLFHIYCLGNFTFTFVLYYIMSTRFWLIKIRQIRTADSISLTNISVDSIHTDTTDENDASKSEVNVTNRKLKFYKMLFILNEMFNRSWANLMIPGFKFLIIIVIVSALYGTIRFTNSAEFLNFIWCPMMASFLVTVIVLIPPMFASLQEMSVSVIGKRDEGGLRNGVSSGKSSRSLEQRLVSRVLESCNPLTCRAGAFYTFDRNTGLTCLNLIFQMTAYFLVAG